ERAAQSLHGSEGLLKEMLDRAELIAMIVGTDWRISYCNDYLVRLTGYSREEIVGADYYERFFSPGEPHSRRVLEAVFADDPQYRHHESDIRLRSGERRLIRWNNTLLRDAAGEVIGFATLAEDVT